VPQASPGDRSPQPVGGDLHLAPVIEFRRDMAGEMGSLDVATELLAEVRGDHFDVAGSSPTSTMSPFLGDGLVPAAPHPCRGPLVWITREEVRGSNVAGRAIACLTRSPGSSARCAS